MTENAKPNNPPAQSHEDRQHTLDRKRYTVEKATLFFLFLYVTIAAFQWYEMQKGLDLQKRIARAAYGPNVKVVAIGAYRDEKIGRVWTRVYFKNVGSHEAENAIVVIKVDFLKSPPSQSQRNFARSEFSNMPNRLRPLSEEAEPIEAPNANVSRLISRDDYTALEVPEMNVYVWGEIRYQDFTDHWIKNAFCRYASAKDVLTGKNGGNGNVGAQHCE